jgi:hypothetical protein
MNDEFKEEFIHTSQRVKKSLIEGILEMYLFRVYDFNSFLVGALLSFFPSFF